MKSLLITTILVIIFSLSLMAQEPVTQIEGFLEVHPSDDTTSVYIGNLAGQKSIPFVFQGIGSYNAFVGSLSGYRNTNGYGNSFFGSLSGWANTDGYGNSFFGSFSGSSNTDGSDNSFFGSDSGSSITTGQDNSFFGESAGRNIRTGNRNVIIGQGAGAGSNASDMIIIGNQSGPSIALTNDSMKLYIDIEKTGNPLIYGDFHNDLLRINGTLELGAQNHYSGNDDGVIRSPETGDGSDLFLVSNDAVVLEIGNKSNSSGSFQIWQGLRTSGSGIGTENLIFKVDKNGKVDAKGTINAMAFNTTSDVNRKDSFAPINTTKILDKIAGLPITEWQYKGSTDRHIGPMAQDFYAAFGLGQGETTIATVDADGVALAAIQELNEKVEKENAVLKKEVSNLTERLERLERLLLEK